MAVRNASRGILADEATEKREELIEMLRRRTGWRSRR